MKAITEKRPQQSVKLNNSVVIGLLVGLAEDGTPLVTYPGNPKEEASLAHSTTLLETSDLGCQLALLFENGDASRPIVIGKIHNPALPGNNEDPALQATVDGRKVTLKADQQLTLECGKAAITLRADGKIQLRGEYILSRSNGANKIKGASIELN